MLDRFSKEERETTAAEKLLDESIRRRLQSEEAGIPSGPAADAPPESGSHIITCLAQLSSLDYDRCRQKEAEKLGVRVATLDAEVRKVRGETAEDVGSGRAVVFEDPEPWPEAVDGALVLDALVGLLRRFVIVSDDAYPTIALWVVHTYAIECAHATPYLRAFSAAKRCGKSKLLDVLELLVKRPLKFSSATASSVFRVIEAHNPTVLIDEADNFIKDNPDLQGLLNDGYRTNGRVLRSVPKGDDFEVRAFSVWGAKAIAGIGKLHGTLEDRCITIEMKRKQRKESVERLRMRIPPQEVAVLRRQITRFVADTQHALLQASPYVPEALNDRAAEIWEPLLAIADVAAGDWPELARQVFLALSGEEDIDDESIGVQLLADIKQMFDEQEVDKLSSDDLTGYLVGIEGRPWAEYGRGKPLTKYKLSSLLKPFGVVSGTIRVDIGTIKGYQLSSFDDAFTRYLHFNSSPRHNVYRTGLPADFKVVTNTKCYDLETALKPNKDVGCDDVTTLKKKLHIRIDGEDYPQGCDDLGVFSPASGRNTQSEDSAGDSEAMCASQLEGSERILHEDFTENLLSASDREDASYPQFDGVSEEEWAAQFDDAQREADEAGVDEEDLPLAARLKQRIIE